LGKEQQITEHTAATTRFVRQDKPIIYGSSDPSFRGDPTRYNPEELLVASISACHMLWYLHLCASAKIVVTDYVDHPVGVMEETNNGTGRFTEVTLKPRVAIALQCRYGNSNPFA
jgi:organic hydroperoxide reductase OsmC/OhrA